MFDPDEIASGLNAEQAARLRFLLRSGKSAPREAIDDGLWALKLLRHFQDARAEQRTELNNWGWAVAMQLGE